MKKGSKIVQVTAGVMAIAALALAGCGGENPGSPSIGRDPSNPPVYNSEKTFRMGAWGLPLNANKGADKYLNNPDYATVENWQIMKNCGYNYAFPIHDYEDSEIFNTLEKAQAVGMKVLVRDFSPHSIQACIEIGGDYAEARARFAAQSDALKARYDQFKEYESFAGVLAYDEPPSTLFPAIAAAQDWFLKYYEGYEFNINLLPNYATGSQLFGTDSNKGYTYADHVRMFVEEVNPQSVGYDHYALMRDAFEEKYLLDDFMYNLYLFAEQSKAQKVPFYIYLQTMGFYDNVPLSCYADFAWQAYTSMAFGIQGIQTFCYWTLPSTQNNIREGCVDPEGNKLPAYDWVQQVFSEIKSFESVYLCFDWDGFKLYEGGLVENSMFGFIRDKQLESLKGVKEVKTDEDLVIGQFLDKDGYPAFMVSNASSPFELKDADVELTFDSDVTAAVVYAKGEKRDVELTGHKLTLHLDSGEGYFVLPL